MAEANVVLNLSHFAESFGRTVAEAMAARRLVIAYNWGALPELIQDGETGFVVSYRNVDELTARVKELCENSNVILEMGERGRAFVSRHYSPRMLAKRLEDVYSHILGADRSVSTDQWTSAMSNCCVLRHAPLSLLRSMTRTTNSDSA